MRHPMCSYVGASGTQHRYIIEQKKGNKKAFISVSSRKTFKKQLDKAIDFHSGTHLTDNTVSS